jgi:L-threonylcarbamoyladenylate synthase
MIPNGQPSLRGHKTKILPAHDASAISLALSLIQAGELIAFPTDTVYGVGCLATLTQAIEQIYVIKGRDASKAIPILLGDITDLTQVTHDMGEKALRLAERFWPGPLTLVVPRHPALPENLSPEQPGEQPTIGVRMPDHPVALALLRQAGPMAVTSANLSGGANTCTAQEVLAQLGGRIPLILDGGRTPGGTPSTVVDCTGPEPVILRQGPISSKDLRAALS